MTRPSLTSLIKGLCLLISARRGQPGAALEPVTAVVVMCAVFAGLGAETVSENQPLQAAAQTGTVRLVDGRSQQGRLRFAPGSLVLVESEDGRTNHFQLADVLSIRFEPASDNSQLVLSINSQGTGLPMAPAEMAGLVRASNWNSFTKRRNTGELRDNSGRPTGITYRFSGANFDDHVNRAIPDMPGDFRMMRGYYDQTDGMIHRIADIPYPHYDLYVYFDRADDDNCRTFNHKFWVTDGGGANVLAGPVYAQDRHRATFNGRFIEVSITSTNDDRQTAAGNCIRFTNLTASSVNIMAGNGLSSWGECDFSRSCVNGIQLVAGGGRSTRLRHGLVLRDGNTVAGSIRSADTTAVQFIASHGAEAAVPISRVARLIFAPVFPDLERNIPRGKTGVLLRGEDFLEADFKGLAGGRLRTASLLFGTRSFDAGSELVAVVLADSAPVRSVFAMSTRDGGLLLADSLDFGSDSLRASTPGIGLLRFGLSDLLEITRTQPSR